MAKEKSNSELVKEFFAAEREKGVHYYSQRPPAGAYSGGSLVFRSLHGQDGISISGHWLKERIRHG